jgi:hypothetical protein
MLPSRKMAIDEINRRITDHELCHEPSRTSICISMHFIENQNATRTLSSSYLPPIPRLIIVINVKSPTRFSVYTRPQALKPS